MVLNDWKVLYDNIFVQVKDGIIVMLCIDDVVCCILCVKVCVGFFDKLSLVNCLLFGDCFLIGKVEYCEIVVQVVCELLVLFKNKNKILLLFVGKCILVVGDGVDNIGKQFGGWSIMW